MHQTRVAMCSFVVVVVWSMIFKSNLVLLPTFKNGEVSCKYPNFLRLFPEHPEKA